MKVLSLCYIALLASFMCSMFARNNIKPHDTASRAGPKQSDEAESLRITSVS